jgi:succinate-acetate transporter protein
VEKGQHICHHGVSFLRIVLVLARSADHFGETGLGPPSNDTAMAAYLGMWGLFTAVMFIGTLRLHVAGQIVFGSLTVLFFLLAIGDFTHASAGFKHFTGYEGIFCGFSAIYAGLAQVLNEIFGKTILPLGTVME